MRLVPLALLGLVIAIAPLPDGAQAGSSKRQAGIQRSAPVRGQLGETRDQRAASAAVGCAPRRASRCPAPKMQWMDGLAPAAGTQAEDCPTGTMATLARGHDDIIRCMPL